MHVHTHLDIFFHMPMHFLHVWGVGYVHIIFNFIIATYYAAIRRITNPGLPKFAQAKPHGCKRPVTAYLSYVVVREPNVQQIVVTDKANSQRAWRDDRWLLKRANLEVRSEAVLFVKSFNLVFRFHKSVQVRAFRFTGKTVGYFVNYS